MDEREIALVYDGGGYGGWLPGVPARDLSGAEVAEHGEEFLLATGLYARPAPSQNTLGGGPTQTKAGAGAGGQGGDA